ncbi:DUF1109 domain-containing protein [Rhizobium sp. SL86]|uniref:DUF1109 domain-containing protein n=1 Tax=Rhizobium sp. SL86 TaxID=2995148 RepID=UPI002275D1F0|nr:DUF1109 domain-containing protein [Rhizobium sp. SL86]MCY1666578.1 DUF1109 domain-containing protein [Rhizobium sp. SL86]
MKTDDLINLLAQDTAVKRRLLPLMNLALIAGGLVTSSLLFAELGLRENLLGQMETMRVIAKVAISLLFAVGSVLLVRRIGQPGLPIKPMALFLLLPAGLLVTAVGAELMVLPRSVWLANLIGRNSLFCIAAVPVLALPPLAAFLLALRNGAPESPTMAGAFAGLAAAGIAVTAYALHCTDDSPLFVATWYGLAVTVVTVMGAALGRLFLRW